MVFWNCAIQGNLWQIPLEILNQKCPARNHQAVSLDSPIIAQSFPNFTKAIERVLTEKTIRSNQLEKTLIIFVDWIYPRRMSIKGGKMFFSFICLLINNQIKIIKNEPSQPCRRKGWSIRTCSSGLDLWLKLKQAFMNDFDYLLKHYYIEFSDSNDKLSLN